MEYRQLGEYRVYFDGSLVRNDWSVVPTFLTKKGYKVLRIRWPCGKYKSGFHHKAVAMAWLGPRPDGFEIDHINGDRADNRASNLQYLSRHDNRVKSYKEGTRDVRGAKNANAKYSDKIELLCKELDKVYEEGRRIKYQSIEDYLKIPKHTIRAVWNGKQWKNVSSKYSFSNRFTRRNK